MSSPLISVVIPTYNYGHLVGEAVESVLAQTYPNVEIIVVDDGSIDDTRERLGKYEGRIRYHFQPNAGLSAARNTGIGLAKGELIALLDSDDAFHPEKLAIQVRYLQEQPQVGLIGTESFSDEPITWTAVDTEQALTNVSPVTLEDVVMKSRFAPSSVLVRRECFDRAGLFDTDLKSVEDRDMWIRIACHDRLAMARAPVTWYRQTPGSMSRNAAKMEHFESLVLSRAFKLNAVKRMRLLRQRALALAALAAARRYQSAGDFRTGFGRLAKSIVSWPLPFGPNDGVVICGRVRLAIAMIRQVLRGTRPASTTSQAQAPAI